MKPYKHVVLDFKRMSPPDQLRASREFAPVSVDSFFERCDFEKRVKIEHVGIETTPSMLTVQGMVRKFFAFSEGSLFAVPNS
jgi:hypothetical protein